MPTLASSPANYTNIRPFEKGKANYSLDRIFNYNSIPASLPINSISDEIKNHFNEYNIIGSQNLSLRDSIDKSKGILLLKNNWDDCGALEISRIAYDRAIHFLESYSSRIFDVSERNIEVPDIVPVKDGSVDLEWNLSKSYLIINFKGDYENEALYYWALKDGNDIILDANGQIKLTNVNDKFASQILDLS